MSTLDNTKHIKSTKVEYDNLHEEITGIHASISLNTEGIDNTNKEITLVKNSITDVDTKVQEVDTRLTTDIDNIKVKIDGINIDTVQEVIDAREGFKTLDDRLDYIQNLDIFKENLKLSTTRTYEYYDNGNIKSETIKGDVDYKIEFGYDGMGNVTSENHYKNGVFCGRKVYTYDPTMTNIVKIVSDKADDMQIVRNDDTTKRLDDRISIIEALNIASELDDIKASLLLPPYDGKKMQELVYGFSSRLDIVEQFLPENIGDLINIPEILARIDELEKIAGNIQYIVDEFDYNGNEYKLSGVTDKSKLKVYIDGLIIKEGIGYDYILKDDNRTISLLLKLLNGMVIRCEYY